MRNFKIKVTYEFFSSRFGVWLSSEEWFEDEVKMYYQATDQGWLIQSVEVEG